MFTDYFEQFDIIPQTVLIGGAPGVPEQHKEIIKNVLNDQGIQSARWVDTGAVISSHGGPGAVGIAGIEKA